MLAEMNRILSLLHQLSKLVQILSLILSFMHLQKMGVQFGKNFCGGLTPVQLLLCSFLHIGAGERRQKTEVKMLVGQDEVSSIGAGKVQGGSN